MPPNYGSLSLSPLVAAASGITRSTTTPTIRHVQDVFAQLRIGVGATNAIAEGRRHASVKSQGAYKLRDSSTIPKKLGAKKSGGMSPPQASHPPAAPETGASPRP
ncbi:hypothetical protein NUW58_g10861 [Xylaria curta]|uniref:Uncharacterized protein n=1 Tax=Xylaria curta TaxID=42375 RepID=A0ACC1MFG8_9PEZI|nr:hypothetical protein NUW58_g10861 [Xylaria curta]